MKFKRLKALEQMASMAGDDGGSIILEMVQEIYKLRMLLGHGTDLLDRVDHKSRDESEECLWVLTVGHALGAHYADDTPVTPPIKKKYPNG